MEPPAGDRPPIDEPDETVAEAEDVAELKALDGVTDAGSPDQTADAAGETAEAAEQTVEAPEEPAADVQQAAARAQGRAAGHVAARLRPVGQGRADRARYRRPKAAALVEMEEAAALDERAPPVPAAEEMRSGPQRRNGDDARRASPSRSMPSRSRAARVRNAAGRSRERRTGRRGRRRDRGIAGQGFPGGAEVRPVDPRKAAGAGARPFGRHAALRKRRVLRADRLSLGRGAGAKQAASARCSPTPTRTMRAEPGPRAKNRPADAAEDARWQGIPGRGLFAVGAVERRQGTAARAVARQGRPFGRPVAADRRTRSARRRDAHHHRHGDRRRGADCARRQHPLDQPAGRGAVRHGQRRGGGQAFLLAVRHREPAGGARLSERADATTAWRAS